MNDRLHDTEGSSNKALTLSASVIVCTYNRASSLAQTLESLEKQVVRPGTEWEVVVVDNNSRDDTRAVVEGRQRNWPRIRYLFERAQGLSNARNCGIRAARGEILLFTDDDVCPEPDWVQRILDGMALHECDACGGYIAPRVGVTPAGVAHGALSWISRDPNGSDGYLSDQ